MSVRSLLFETVCINVLCCGWILLALLKREFKLEQFVEFPTLEGFHLCTEDNLLLIANHYNIAISKHIKKQVVKLYTALVDESILLQVQSTPQTHRQSSQTVDEAVRLKELEVELQHLALKETELQYL